MLIATTTVNFAYLSGVRLETFERFKAAVLCGDRKAFVVPALDAGRVSGDVHYYSDGEDPAEALRRAAADCRSDVVKVDGGTQLRHLEVIRRALPHARIELGDEELVRMRSVKKPDEVERIRTAARHIKDVIEGVLAELSEGVTEGAVAAKIYVDLVERELEPFWIGVQFGPNSAIPHHGHSQKKLQRGEAVVVDVSASYMGYFGDVTRSAFYGTPIEDYVRAYRAVEEAQRAAIAAAKPGISAGEIDAAARRVLEAWGYGHHFIHRTGHGLGLEVHEAPNVAPNSSEVIQRGMVFTVEPGVYLRGRFGIRIEDDVHVVDTGAELLSL